MPKFGVSKNRGKLTVVIGVFLFICGVILYFFNQDILLFGVDLKARGIGILFLIIGLIYLNLSEKSHEHWLHKLYKPSKKLVS